MVAACHSSNFLASATQMSPRNRTRLRSTSGYLAQRCRATWGATMRPTVRLSTRKAVAYSTLTWQALILPTSLEMAPSGFPCRAWLARMLACAMVWALPRTTTPSIAIAPWAAKKLRLSLSTRTTSARLTSQLGMLLSITTGKKVSQLLLARTTVPITTTMNGRGRENRASNSAPPANQCRS